MSEGGTVWVVTPRCSVCGERGELEVDGDGLGRWMAGELVQRALPDLDADQRELLVSGTHAPCWVKMFGQEDEEDGS
jgi:hypothetical protein